ncbi:MAG TPA: ABC transporter ATP-binding protein [Candidatus Anaerofilum faecale]|nr:ABC transporter ATP-binding protein [Candidatus Anaerofilum faecale]
MQLRLDRVTRQFGTRLAVDRFSACLQPGVYGLLGPNGAGKTTLMRLLCGILSPTSGEILLDGIPVRQMGEHYRALLGYLPQHFGCYPGYTVEQFMLYLAAVKGLPRSLARRQTDRLLEQVGLENWKKQRVRALSGGTLQRLGIAQALLGNPSILVLDEPTSGLDPKERIRFRNLISEYAAGRVVLLSTHIVGDLEAVAGQLLMMDGGQLLCQGTPEALLRQVEGMVWETALPAAEARALADRCHVTAIRLEGETTHLRLLADARPHPLAQPAAPNFEDLYLYHFADKGQSLWVD